VHCRLAIWFFIMSMHPAALSVAFQPPTRRSRAWTTGTWTCVGALAIPLWATWPSLALRTREIPTFECLSIAYLIGWLSLRALEYAGSKAFYSGQPVERRDDALSTNWQSWIPAAMFAVGLSASAALFVFATFYISAAQAHLISYLWPAMIAGFGAALGMFRLRTSQILGIAMGFAGAVIVMRGGALSFSYPGVGLALVSGALWAGYCVYRLKYPDSPRSFLGRGCAISGVSCLGLHFMIEPTVVPSLGTALATVAIGVIPTALGNFLWDQGFRRGDSKLLAVMAYATPLCSALLLSLLGIETLTWNLLIGALVIAGAGMLSRTDP
jgi:drug/metabolite transporter (DMT)-like permease